MKGTATFFTVIVAVCTQTTKVASDDYTTDLLAVAVFIIIVTTMIRKSQLQSVK
jgi:hypothetical protein